METIYFGQKVRVRTGRHAGQSGVVLAQSSGGEVCTVAFESSYPGVSGFVYETEFYKSSELLKSEGE